MGFERSWKAEVLTAAPLIAPVRSYVWPQVVEGEEDAMGRGALRVMVRPAEGGSYLLTCALGFADKSMISGVFGCPDRDWMCVVAGGYAYLADSREPGKCTLLGMKPVVEVHECVEAGVVVFVGFHGVWGWKSAGDLWRAARLTAEGVRVVGIEGAEMRGFGWDMRTDKEVEFGLDLRTGVHWGGVRF